MASPGGLGWVIGREFTMRDVTNSPSTTGPYECFNCGQIVTDPDAGRCPECHGQLRNRQMPIE